MQAPVKRKQQKYLHAVFTANQYKYRHYDLFGKVPDKFPFTWFRVSDAHNAFLRNQGADNVAESFDNGTKVLFTGMRRIGSTLWWEGNRYNNGKKSLILFRFHTDKKYFDVYLFSNYYPALEAKKERFIWLFISTREKEMPEAHAPDISNVQSNIGIPIVCTGKDSSNL